MQTIIKSVLAHQVNIDGLEYLRLSKDSWFVLSRYGDYISVDHESLYLEIKFQVQNEQDFLEDKYA